MSSSKYGIFDELIVREKMALAENTNNLKYCMLTLSPVTPPYGGA